MKQGLTVIVAALVAVIASYMTVHMTLPEGGVEIIKPAQQKETAYERVIRTGTIRCGYIDYPPHIMVDPASHEITGIMHDIAEETARLLDLKIDWAAEVGWATTVTEIQTGRVDAICTSFWRNPLEGRHLGFTMPLFYSAVGAYVRADDHRFDKDLSLINDPKVKIATFDGSIATTVAQYNFPKASILSLPNLTAEVQLLLEVATGKADVTFLETYIGNEYMANNPGQLRFIAPDGPLEVFENTMAIPQDDVRFKSMIDSALVQLLNNGFVEQTIRKYEQVEGGIYRVAKPYRQE